MVRRKPLTAGPPWLQFGGTLLTGAAEGGADPAVVMADARKRWSGALAEDPAFAAIATNAALSETDVEVLALLAAAEASWSLQRTVGDLQGDRHRNRISLGLLPALLGAGHPGPLTLAPDSRLLRAELVRVDDVGAWSSRVVVVEPSVLWALLGDTSLDPDLPSDATFLDGGEHDGEDDGPPAALVVVIGTDRTRRWRDGMAAAVGERFIAVDQPMSPEARSAVVREATITGRGVLIDVDDVLEPATRHMVDRANHLVWVVSSRHALPIDELPNRPWREVETPARPATPAEWAAVVGSDVDPVHGLSLDQLRRVAKVLGTVEGDIDAAVRRLAAGRLEHLTRRVRPTRSIDDIVLSDDRLQLLQSIIDRMRHGDQVYREWGYPTIPSRGVVALFAGPPGTGKTLAAEIIAGSLGLDLFKLDLSSVVSKYIGETEKNLEQIFDAAAAGNAVLFFDEADSLFGKRSEVKDARDRYANIEVSYLLQRLEAHDGLIVLATNREKDIDEAFMRRIHVRIEMPLPAPEERLRLWKQSFPAAAPLAKDIDFDLLASRFEIAGGSIRNVATTAAFIAAARDTQITMETVVAGLSREYRKLGRLITEKDFGPHVS